MTVTSQGTWPESVVPEAGVVVESEGWVADPAAAVMARSAVSTTIPASERSLPFWEGAAVGVMPPVIGIDPAAGIPRFRDELSATGSAGVKTTRTGEKRCAAHIEYVG